MFRTGLAICAVLLTIAPARAATTVETLGSSSIVHDESARTWTLGAGGARLVLGLDQGVDLQLLKMESPTGSSWLPTAQADTWVIINGKPEPLGRRASGFDYDGIATENTGHALRLHAAFRYRPANLRVVRHYAIANGSPTFEAWTTFESLGGEASLSDLNGVELKVRDGTVRWLNGLQGDTSDVAHMTAFSLQRGHLGPGQALELGAQGRSSEESVPWFAIDGDDDEFFAGFLWSGAWSLNLSRADDTLSVSFGLTNMTTRVGDGPIEAPHVVFGAAKGGLQQASLALRTYLVEGIRAGRGFSPLVTYNTWFADGTRIDQQSVRTEMQRVAGLGTELFVLDAGWYAGAGAQNVFDFHSGLGRWQPDPDRFPDGIGALTDYAHELGMKFGIWVEPERMNLDVVEEQGADSTWLATSGGQQVTDRTGQLCLAGAAGRQWLWDRLTSFIDQVHPDYLKWDNNAWLNCDREGHGHGALDGNFAHVSALYGMLDALRSRYPDMLVENVSGGGNRLDFGMLRYSDVGWMDDRSGTAAHVRHNIQGLSAAFPPAYLFSFVTTQDEAEQLTSYQDLALYFRSRMMGAFGMSFSLPGVGTVDAIVREIEIYKRLRPILNDSAGALVSDQAQTLDGPPWDVFEALSGDGGSILLYAFQSTADCGTLSLKPVGLLPDAVYFVESIDFGEIGAAPGLDLMGDGIEVFPSERSGAHILILTRMP